MNNDKWKFIKKDDFGWYLEGRKIKALWAKKISLAESGTEKISGPLSTDSVFKIQKKIEDHHTDIEMNKSALDGLQAGAFRAFKISDNDGGGYMIVYPKGLRDVHTIGKQRGGLLGIF